MTPDGTLVGTLSVPGLTEQALEVTVSALDRSGAAFPVRSLTVHPALTRPSGNDCPAFGPQASLRLDVAGLSESTVR
ncbi:hypothetical protein [Specibacter cremeus]|uniref:hypothetical protein n=1 Tax=Specibacter cremeus TaxID=1629051 RepID=UPI000F76A2E4|nr:hypothetical protein [Specibacter cremeus]